MVALLYKRKTPEEIAKAMGISILTYRTHMKNIHRKLDAHDSLEVILKLENDCE
ncbi:MAG: LuxR C-terminal-related transcriptional regulator [Blastocatellia bacterium]